MWLRALIAKTVMSSPRVEQLPSTWPHQDHSEFVIAHGIHWHVQRWGFQRRASKKPVLLLLHGTGASTHSWRDLAPTLAKRFNVIAPDLPGHAFTSHPGRSSMTLPGMAAALFGLLEALGNVQPQVIAGHSAGAAIAVQMALQNDNVRIANKVENPVNACLQNVISFNGALLPLESLSGQLFSPLAKLLALNPLVPRLFAWRANNPSVVKDLLDSTGSDLGSEGLQFYSDLVRMPSHAAGALSMMANWNLDNLKNDIAKLQVPLRLIVGTTDKTIHPSTASRVQLLLPSAQIHLMQGLGHLAHEEDPLQACQLISI
jgi:magnesium chelatase accessory protein